ncbi:MAG TPA: hypothetical protein VKU44_02330, partial [Terriglobia bacterium]|nr:hypothetical protein [Terriglobia bacterium]
MPAALVITVLAARAVWSQQAPTPAVSPAPAGLEDVRNTVSIRADFQQKIKDTYHLTGHVEVTYHEMKATADAATYDQPTGEIVARGHVTFSDAQALLDADEAHYNLRSGTGWFVQAHGYLHAHIRPRPRMLMTENPFYLRAQRVERLDEDTFRVERGRLSTCEDEKKGWSVAVREATVKVGDKVVGHDDVFRLMGVPLLYSPVYANSISRDPRQTGFLLPQVGNSTQKGFTVGDGVFWAINPSLDLMVGLEEFSKRGVATIGQIRAKPNETSDFTLDYFGVNDKLDSTACPAAQAALGECIGRAAGESVRAVGQTDDLPYGFRGV